MASNNSSSAPLFGNHMEGQQLHAQPLTHTMGAHRNDNAGERAQDTTQNNEGNANWVPRPKRIACVVCRKRKLRCDGMKPSCGSCARLGHECGYNEVRRKSGPKRGYVKQLEARLAQVETLLKTQEPSEPTAREPSPVHDNVELLPNVTLSRDNSGNLPDLSSQPPNIPLDAFGDQPSYGDPNIGNTSNDFSWDMISLDLEEPLPSQEVCDELDEIYFNKIHPSIPIIHRPRYYAAMNLAPTMRPPVCLRYIMWTHAASVTDKYESLHPHFYQRARRYAERDQMKGLGENILSVALCQCWNLIGTYEFKMMYFPRAWMSCGQAARLAVMLGLQRQDGTGLDVKQCLPPPRDWTEREERRRTFWATFCQDRYASIGTGWPMAIDEQDILTNLPASEHAFVNCQPQKAPTLSEVVAGNGTSSLSEYGGVILLTCLFGRNLHHLHRVTAKDNDHDLNGEFWKRHRALDNILLSTSLSLPSHLRLPEGINDPCIIFANMCIHTATICLHQAAIFKAEKNDMPAQIAAESKRRCVIAADQITNIMKMISHIDLATTYPFLAFCLYVACRIFIQYFKSRPDDQTVKSSLQFLLSALNALKKKNPLTGSFLIQLDVDLQGSGVELPDGVSKFSYGMQRAPSLRADPDCFAMLNGGQTPASRDQGSGATPEGSQPQMTTTTQSCSSLPTRQKSSSQLNGSNTVGANSQGANGQDSSFSCTFPPDISIIDDQIRPLVMELDGSTEVSTGSERHHSNSDRTTPGTNKSSNSSFSPQNNPDNPSPPNQRQQSQHLSANMYTTNPITTSQTTSPSYFDNPNDSITSGTSHPPFPYPAVVAQVPPDSGATENPFAIPSGWNYPMQQPGDQAPGEDTLISDGDLNFPSLDGMPLPSPPTMTNWGPW